MKPWLYFATLILAGLAHADSFEECLTMAKEVENLGGRLTSQVPQEWTGRQFTDPRFHNKDNFVYIVHGVGSEFAYDLQTTEIGKFVDRFWVSIISNDAPFTYMQESGLILAIEPDNVVSNSCYDTVFTFSRTNSGLSLGSVDVEGGFRKYTSLHRLLSPAQMLLASAWPNKMDVNTARKIIPGLVGNRYLNNELLLKGRGDAGHIIRTVGVYINSTDDYLPTIVALKEFAKKYGLPVVQIEQPNAVGE